MTTHETDDPRELDHAEENYGVDSEGDEVAQEQAAEAEEVEPVVDDDLLDHTDPPPVDDATSTDETGTDADAGDEQAIALGPVDTEAGEGAAGAGTTESDEADDAVGAVGAVEADEAVGAVGAVEADDDLAEEPVIVELEETEVEVLDEPADDTATAAETESGDDGDGDESVLLTESAPGSVLPPEEPEEPAEPNEPEELAESDEAVEAEPLPIPEPSPLALLEPVSPDTPLDPGTGTYRERWSAIQGGFVDEPFRTVESAGALVAQMWQELERSIAEQRAALDGAWGTGSSTDDLRATFRRYREMFNRLATLLSATTTSTESQPSG